MKYLLILAVACPPLAGCQTAMDRAANDCAAFGYTRGTLAFTQCNQTEYHARLERYDAAMARVSQGLRETGQSFRWNNVGQAPRRYCPVYNGYAYCN